MIDEIVKEAHKRFAELEEAERDLRRLWVEDLKMAHGDSDNNWQWDPNDLTARRGKTSVTVNKIKIHNRQITNDARQNKVSIKVKAEGNGAHKKTADAIQGMVKHIEKTSKAETAYDIAFDFAVNAGLGYWYVTTDYVDNETNDKEILIKSIANPLNVYLCEGEEFDGSDSPYGFMFKDMRKEEFKAKYKEADENNSQQWGDEETEWNKKDKIRVAHYYKVVEKADRLYFNERGEGIKLSEVNDHEMKKALKSSGLKSRPIKNKKVMCYLIAGNEMLEEYEWIGSTIPIVPCKGEEKVIDGELYRAGNTRLMKDPQRILNYEKSCEVEFKKLQGKTPWIGAVEAFSGLEDIWASANTVNHAYLPFNHIDDSGNQIPVPTRVQPPVTSEAYLKGMEIANDDMQQVSGQFDAQLGENVNQQSGRALLAVQARGLVSTFDYVDNKARALKRTGEILVEIIPKVYDVEAVKKIIGDDEKEADAIIDPEQPEAYREVETQDGIKEIYNPGVGRYVVDVQVGSDYGTKRQEAFNALTEVAKSDPNFMQLAGDIYFDIADFPLAEKISERYKKALPPAMQDKEEGGEPEIPPEVQQKMQDAEAIIKQLDETIQAMTDKLNDKSLEKEKLAIDRANAETNILKSAAAYMPPDAVATVAMQLLTALKFEGAEEKREEQTQQQPAQPQQPEQPPMQQPDPQDEKYDMLINAISELSKKVNTKKEYNVIRDNLGNIIKLEA